MNEPNELTDEELKSLRAILSQTGFLWTSFPQPSQTFLHRELSEFRRLGLPLQVLSPDPFRQPQVDPILEELCRRGHTLGPIWRWLPKGVHLGTRLGSRFLLALRYLLSLPHRSLEHRGRSIGALCAAAALVPEIRARRIRYVHAQFAARATEIAMSLHLLGIASYGATWHAFGIWRDRNILEAKIQHSRTILTCTRYNAQHLQKIASNYRDKVHLVYHGIDLTNLPKATSPAALRSPRIVAVGRLVPKKGFSVLVDAAALLAEQGVSFRMEIYGDGPLRQPLGQQIEQRGLSDRIELKGSAPNCRILEAIARARMLVAPSVTQPDGDIDGIPNVILEAMALRRPVVSTELSGVPEAVLHGETGYLAPPGDASTLARHIGVLLTQPGLASKLGQAGFRVLQEHFDLRINAIKQLRLLHSAFHTSGAHRPLLGAA